MPSLQEQMLKSGLVSKDQAKRIQKDKQKKTKTERKSKTPAPVKLSAADKLRQQQAERDRELNLKRERKAAKRALAAEVRQLVEDNRLDRKDAGIAFNFVHNKKVKKIHITEAMREKLNLSQVAIVCRLSRNQELFDVVPIQIARKLEEKRPGIMVQMESMSTPDSDENDPYADYQVPDDLMW